jgi:hypothetical protein
LACRDIRRQQGVQAPRGLNSQPAADGLAVHSQEVRHLLARLGVPAGQQIEHLEARLFMAIMLTLQPMLEISWLVSKPR